MVGEIRDAETAQYAVQAALTGHLVFSTLHTNTAVGAITRLVDLGIERFLVASTVIGLVAQRLLRMVCPACADATDVTDDDARADRAGSGHRSLAPAPRHRLRRSAARPATTDAPRRSRWSRSATRIRVMIRDGADENDIVRAARQDGVEPLMSNAIRKLLEGRTTPDEILRVIPTAW